MKLYTYNNKSGDFLGEIEAPICQIENKPLQVINSTENAPPALLANQAARWSGESWNIVPDLRGSEYWLDGTLHVITIIGVDMPEGATLDKPLSVIDAEINQKKQQARAEINRMRDARICAGVEFPSESGVMFDSDDAAQKNVNGAVTMCMIAQSSGAAFEQDWIAQDNRVITLDAAGIIGLGVTVGRHVGLHKLQANGYKNMIDTATDTAAIQFFVDEYAALS